MALTEGHEKVRVQYEFGPARARGRLVHTFRQVPWHLFGYILFYTAYLAIEPVTRYFFGVVLWPSSVEPVTLHLSKIQIT